MAKRLQEFGNVRFVDGMRTDSIQEFYVAYALLKLGYDFKFQVQFFGGARIQGGIVIDFMVFTKPKQTPLFVDGYYHTLPAVKAEDSYKRQLLMAELRGGAQQWVAIDASKIDGKQDDPLPLGQRQGVQDAIAQVRKVL